MLTEEQIKASGVHHGWFALHSSPRLASQHPLCAGGRGPACASISMETCHRCPYHHTSGSRPSSTPWAAPIERPRWSLRRPSLRLGSAAQKACRHRCRPCCATRAPQGPGALLAPAKASRGGCWGSRRHAAPSEQSSGDGLPYSDDEPQGTCMSPAMHTSTP